MPLLEVASKSVTIAVASSFISSDSWWLWMLRLTFETILCTISGFKMCTGSAKVACKAMMFWFK